MLKKSFIILVGVLLSFTVFASPVFALEKGYNYLKIVKLYIGIKEAEVNFSMAAMDQAAYVKNSRTLVPFRFLGESLGAQIVWDPLLRQATLKLSESEVIVKIGSNEATVNGKIYKLDVPAEAKGGRTFIPLRFVSEALGAAVDYEAKTQMVMITYVDTSNWIGYKNSDGGITYRYPSDWIVEVGENSGLTRIKSPNGSYFWEATRKNLNVEQTIAVLKKEWVEEGYTFDSEIILDDSDPGEGSLLIFTSDSGDETDYVYVQKQDGTDDALVIDETIKSGFFEIDDPIIMKIVFG